MSAKIIERLRKKAFDFAMDQNPDKAREALAQIKIVENQMKDPAQTHPTHPCLLYTSPSPRDRTRSRMPSSA